MAFITVSGMLLAVMFVATESFWSVKRFQDESSEVQCFIKIEECSAPLQQIPFFSGEERDYRTLITNIDQVCQYFHESVKCLQPFLQYCGTGELTDMTGAFIAGGSFLCSDHGKSLLRQYQSSTCYDDPNLEHRLNYAGHECGNEAAGPEGGARCEFTREIAQCIAGLFGETCGNVAEQLVGGVLQRVHDVIGDRGCSTEYSDDFFKRSFDLLKKRRL